MDAFEKWRRQNCTFKEANWYYEGKRYPLAKYKDLKLIFESKVKKRKPGGGRKLKYGEPCQLVTFKCPESKAKAFRVAANKILKSYVKERKKV